MNHPLPQPQVFNENQTPPKKTGCGCLLNALIGLSVLIVSILVAAWLLLMHSSLPLRSVVSLIEESGSQSNLKVTGISGSLSSGLQFKKIKWNDGEITDVRVRYSGIMDIIRRKQLIIYEMHVGSAVIDSAFQSDHTNNTGATPNATPNGKSVEPPLRLLQIDRVSLNHIEIKDHTSGVTVNIPKLLWTGFKAEKGRAMEFGNLDAESDYFVIKTTDPTSTHYQKRFEIGIMPKVDAKILRPIRLVAEVGNENDKFIFDLTALDQTVKMKLATDGIGRFSAEGVNLADFIDGPLPQNLRFKAELGNPDSAQPGIVIHPGSFQLGKKSFKIQPATLSGPQTPPQHTIFLAVSHGENREIRYVIGATDHDQESLKPLLTSKPTMSPEDILATLYHETQFSSLSPSDQDGIKRQISWFNFSQPK